MQKLVADYVNDPENNFDLMVEILSEDKEIAMIRKVEGEYRLVVFKSSEDIEIPLSWLNDVIKTL